MFSLFSAASAMLPGGSFSKEVEMGSVAARRDVFSMTGCPSSVEPGTGNCITVRLCADAIASTSDEHGCYGLQKCARTLYHAASEPIDRLSVSLPRSAVVLARRDPIHRAGR